MGIKAYSKSFFSIIDITYISMTFIVTSLMVFQLSQDQIPTKFADFASITKA